MEIPLILEVTEEQTVLATLQNMGHMALLIYIHEVLHIELVQVKHARYTAVHLSSCYKLYRVMKSNQVTTWKKRDYLEEVNFSLPMHLILIH